MFGRDNDERVVGAGLRELAREPLPLGHPPSASFIWWKAQLLRRLDAEREAAAPIEVGDRVHIGVALLGAVALGISAWNQFVPSGLFRLVGVGVTAAILLAAVTVALVASMRGR